MPAMHEPNHRVCRDRLAQTRCISGSRRTQARPTADSRFSRLPSPGTTAPTTICEEETVMETNELGATIVDAQRVSSWVSITTGQAVLTGLELSLAV